MSRDPVDKRQISMKDLVEGTEYEYRVLAVNEAGIGKPSETTGTFTAKDPFDKPGQPGMPKVEEILAENADLAWTKPEKDGGTVITNYLVEAREPGDKWRQVGRRDSITATTYRAAGLREGTQYEFRIIAENKVGQSPPSAPSKSVKYVEKITFTRKLEDVSTTKLKSKIVLECEISKTGLKIEWFKGDKKLRRDDRYDIVADGRVHQLVIEKITAEDGGEYKAVYQKLSTNAKLSIQGKNTSFITHSIWLSMY